MFLHIQLVVETEFKKWLGNGHHSIPYPKAFQRAWDFWRFMYWRIGSLTCKREENHEQNNFRKPYDSLLFWRVIPCLLSWTACPGWTYCRYLWQPHWSDRHFHMLWHSHSLVQNSLRKLLAAQKSQHITHHTSVKLLSNMSW